MGERPKLIVVWKSVQYLENSISYLLFLVKSIELRLFLPQNVEEHREQILEKVAVLGAVYHLDVISNFCDNL